MGPKIRPGSEAPTVRDFIALSFDRATLVPHLPSTFSLREEWSLRYKIADTIIKECRNAPPPAPPGNDDDTGGGR